MSFNNKILLSRKIFFSKKILFTSFVVVALLLLAVFGYFNLKDHPFSSAILPTVKSQTFLGVIDIFNNTVYLLNKEYEVLGKIIIGRREELGLLDGAFAPNGYFYLLSEGNPSSNKVMEPFIFVINPTTFQIAEKIKIDILPANIVITPNGKAYLTHNFEHQDGSGWVVSVLDTTTNKIIKQIKVPGSPFKPKTINKDVYIPVMGGGERHFGNSNVIKIDSNTDGISKLFPDDLTEVPPSDFVIDDNFLVAEFLGINKEDESHPVFEKSSSEWEHFVALVSMDDPSRLQVFRTGITGSIARDFLFTYNKKIYLSYTLTDDQIGKNGFLTIDKLSGNIMEHKIIDDSDWNRNAIDIGDFILIANASKKHIMILDKKKDKFLDEKVLDFTPNHLIWNPYGSK